MYKYVSKKIGNHEISLETGKIAKQADGAVVVKCGDSIILATVCTDKNQTDKDFLPLTVEYREKSYSTGKNSKKDGCNCDVHLFSWSFNCCLSSLNNTIILSGLFSKLTVYVFVYE